MVNTTIGESECEWVRRRAAYHEAGHAVAAHFSGGQVISVTIEQEEVDGGLSYGLTRSMIEGTTRTRLPMEFVVLHGGGLAVMLAFGGEDWRDGIEHDWNAMRLSYREFSPTGDGFDEKARVTFDQALLLLSHHRKAVETLAAAILERITLSGDEVRQIIASAEEES